MIIIDTNILLELEKLDIFAQLKEFSEFGSPVILSSSLDELKKIGSRKSYFAIDYIKKRRIKIIKTGERYTDRAILKYAKPGRDAVATNDKKLIKTLKLNNVKVIRLRQRKYLVFA